MFTWYTYASNQCNLSLRTLYTYNCEFLTPMRVNSIFCTVVVLNQIPGDIIEHTWKREREERERTERQIYILDSSSDYNASRWGQSLTTPACSFTLYLIRTGVKEEIIASLGLCNLKGFKGLNLIYPEKKLQRDRRHKKMTKKEKWPSLLNIIVHCMSCDASANIIMLICLRRLFDD